MKALSHLFIIFTVFKSSSWLVSFNFKMIGFYSEEWSQTNCCVILQVLTFSSFTNRNFYFLKSFGTTAAFQEFLKITTKSFLITSASILGWSSSDHIDLSYLSACNSCLCISILRSAPFVADINYSRHFSLMDVFTADWWKKSH